MKKFNAEDFIEEVKKRPPLWNATIPDYTDKLVKLKHWEELVNIYIHKGASSEERKKLCSTLQQKWRNYRDSFVKQLKKDAMEKESGSKHSKPYGYYKQLMFMKDALPSPFPRRPWLYSTRDVVKSEQEDESGENNDSDSSNETLSQKRRKKKRKCTSITSHAAEVENETESGNETPSASKIKKKNDVDTQLMGVLHRTLDIKKTEEDEDRLFFLSLVKDFKKIPENRQLRTKLELIKVIDEALESTRSNSLQDERSDLPMLYCKIEDNI